MTEGDHAALSAWLEEDRRNRGAFVRAQAVLQAMESAVFRAGDGPRGAAGEPRSAAGAPVGATRRNPRRRLLAAGLAAAVLMGAGTALLLQGQIPRDQRRMELADGSAVLLQGDAEIAADIDADKRSITLVRGIARFDVAPDPDRPFVVRAGEVHAQATGTVYSVGRVGASGARVEVEEGSVMVWARNDRARAVLLRAGGRLSLEPGAADAARAHAPDVGHARMSLDNETIDAAVARFNSVNEVKIVVLDSSIGNARIVGLFDAGEPMRFAQAAAAVAGGRAVMRGNTIHIERQEPQ